MMPLPPGWAHCPKCKGHVPPEKHGGYHCLSCNFPFTSVVIPDLRSPQQGAVTVTLDEPVPPSLDDLPEPQAQSIVPPAIVPEIVEKVAEADAKTARRKRR